MPEPRPRPASDSPGSEREDRGGEVRHLPVPVEPLRPRPVEPAGVRALATAQRPAVPMPLVAAGGFLVGVATWLLARALIPRRRVALGRGRRRNGGIEVTGSRSFLVDVHLIKR